MSSYLFYGYLEKSNDKFLKFYITLKKRFPIVTLIDPSIPKSCNEIKLS